MSPIAVYKYISTGDVFLFVGAVVLLVWRGAYREHPYFTAWSICCAVHSTCRTAILFFRAALGLERQHAYHFMVVESRISSVLCTALLVLSIYGLYRGLMKPLDGLRRIGKIVFRWVAGVSLLLALVIVFGPHPTGSSFSQTVAGQAQEGVSILTLCLLVFVSVATRPLGLTYRSRVFGMTLGLGVMATAGLIQAPWLATSGARSLYSPIYLCDAVGTLVALGIFSTYLLMPEPRRKMVLLPTTSPFFTWNRIAEALGDEPGVVAVGGISPDMFAPAELAAFSGAPLRSEPTPVVVLPRPAPQVASR